LSTEKEKKEDLRRDVLGGELKRERNFPSQVPWGERTQNGKNSDLTENDGNARYYIPLYLLVILPKPAVNTAKYARVCWYVYEIKAIETYSEVVFVYVVPAPYIIRRTSVIHIRE